MINANLLKGKMASKGYTQESLAHKLEISKNTLNAKINGKSRFALDEVLKICDLLAIESADEMCEIFLPTISQYWDEMRRR